ncbi:MSHA biogenesis protein MshI [Pseudomonas sp. HMWF032]|uniref:PilN domain-containing protein n=1 Tax=Pseudomonas sp. HMWF032 TaxID=2056866 RepID=UPI000D36DE4F|nr:PilN domain-containing protein [Pseudomonas sp. HMWF032]PTS82082.1 MSHA biogenesis protein MshI [Pseudomonas sp. HMWF032]PTT80669.1 MSHA biogenesis protein MshI [Pseudomonas sp. HMWF010]
MQNLNLFQIERRQKSGPRRAQMLLGLGVLLVACLGHAAWTGWQLHEGAQRLAVLHAQAQEEEAQLEAVRGNFVEPQLDTRLPEELAAREHDNRELQRLIAYLQVLGVQRSAGFVAPLTALTEQHPQSGLWLSGISLHQGGRHMRLQGRSQDQELLPQYLQRLGQSAVFKGREFARFDVQRGDDQLLHFDLSSQLKDQEAGNE